MTNAWAKSEAYGSCPHTSAQHTPAIWPAARFKHVARIRNGQDYKAVEEHDGPYPVIGSGGEFARASAYLYDGESVLLGRKGTLDKPLYVNGRFWTVDTMFYTEILPGNSPRFVYYLATTLPFDQLATRTALPSMTQEALSNVPIVLPPFTEQCRIAAFLDYETARIDELVHEQRQLNALLTEKHQATIRHTVENGLVSARQGWVRKPFKYIARIRNGRDYKAVEEATGSYPVIGSGGEFARAATYLYDGESVLLGRKGTINQPLYVNGRFWTVDTMFYTEIAPGNAPKYVYYLATTLPFDALVTRTALPSMTQEALGAVLVTAPPLAEQSRIANFLDAESERVDRLQAQQEQNIELLVERRSALISAAVTGQLDLREWRPPESRAVAEVA